MSDTMQAPTEGETENRGSESAGSKRLLVALAALTAAVVVGAAVYFLFLSGGSSPDDELAAPPRATLGGSGATDDPASNGNGQKIDGATKPGDKVPAKYDGKVGRDPFKPLAFEGTEPVADPAAASNPTSGTPADPATQPATQPAAQPTTEPAPAPTATVPTTSEYIVAVKSVNLVRGKAVLTVNGTLYTVRVDEVFPNTTTGPFKVQRLAKTDSGRGTVKVLYGSDLPVILKQGADPITFGSAA